LIIAPKRPREWSLQQRMPTSVNWERRTEHTYRPTAEDSLKCGRLRNSETMGVTTCRLAECNKMVPYFAPRGQAR
jgi:hypothetical protein